MLLELFLYLGTSSVPVSRTHGFYFLLCWKGLLLPRIIFCFFDLFFSSCKSPRCTRVLHCFGCSSCGLTRARTHSLLPLWRAILCCFHLLLTMSGPGALNHIPSEINAAYKERQTDSLSTRTVWG